MNMQEAVLARRADAAGQLERAKSQAGREIDLKAEALRASHVTGGPTQAMVYIRKAEQAKRLLAALEADPGLVPDEAEYPLLAAGLGIDGADLAAVAATVSAKDAAWSEIAAGIDRARREGRIAIEAATTTAEVRAAVAAIAWPAG